MKILAPQPGEIAVDCTLGYGGYATGIDRRRAAWRAADWRRCRSGGIAQDRSLDCGRSAFPTIRLVVRRMNYAGILTLILAESRRMVPMSYLPISDCHRCKSTTRLAGPAFKEDGPLDMRLNPEGAANPHRCCCRNSMKPDWHDCLRRMRTNRTR